MSTFQHFFSRGKEAKGDGPVGDTKMKALVVGKASTITQPMQTGTNGTRPWKFGSYEIAMHSVRLQQSGTMISVDLTWSLTCKLCMDDCFASTPYQ